jgi:hypothetical protein
MTIKGAVLAMGLVAAMAMIPNRSEAAVAVHVGVTAPVVYGGHFGHERVIVGGHGRHWIAPIYAGGVCVHQGYWVDDCAPVVTVPEVVVPAPVVTAPVIYENFGLRFGFDRFGHRFEYRHFR